MPCKIIHNTVEVRRYLTQMVLFVGAGLAPAQNFSNGRGNSRIAPKFVGARHRRAQCGQPQGLPLLVFPYQFKPLNRFGSAC